MEVIEMKPYCPKCNKLSEATIAAIDEIFTVKGENISIKSQVAVCDVCGEKIFNQELDDKSLYLAYSVYRKKHSLLSPSEIANIRKKYSLSQRSLARLLEWGEITINRYETGAIQDPAHNEVLMFISEPKNMKELFEKNNQFLNETVRENLRGKIDELIRDEIKPNFLVSLEEYITSNKKIDEYSGFANFDLEKMINMIIYIAERNKGIFTTKLNKLLWYSDFLHFNKYSKSMSGSDYVHLQLGPVPNNYRWIITAAIDEGLLKSEEVAFPSGHVGEQYKAAAPTDPSFFNVGEKEIRDFVIEYFKDYNCEDIKQYSHKERAYQETEDQQKISYKYATTLSISSAFK